MAVSSDAGISAYATFDAGLTMAIHSTLYIMIKEIGVHGFAQRIVAAEGEGEVADTTADMSVGLVLLYPFGGADEVQSIVVVGFDTCPYCEDAGVEDNVGWVEVNRHQQVVGSLTDGSFTLESSGLPLFIERHDNQSSS